jgi:translation elongation factor EF-4
LTAPSVSYQAVLKSGDLITFDNALDAPEPGDVKTYREPYADVTLLVPQ